MLTKFLKNFTKVIQPFFTIGIKRTRGPIKHQILELNRKLKNIKDIYNILTSYPVFHKTMIEIVKQKTPLLLAIQQGKHKHAMKVAIYKHLNIICNFICNPQLIANGATWTSRFTLVQQIQEQEGQDQERQVQESRQQQQVSSQTSEIFIEQNDRETDQKQKQEQNINEIQTYKNIEKKQQQECSTFGSQQQYEEYVDNLFFNLKNDLEFPPFLNSFSYANLIDFDFLNKQQYQTRSLFDAFLY